MKNFIALCISTFIFCQLSIAQSTFVDNPESVEFNPMTNTYIAAAQSANKLYSVSKGGTPTVWVASISSPHGMAYNAGKLWVCTGGNVKKFDATTAALDATISIGGSFMNGLCADGAGHVFVTDFSAKKIYKINTADNSFSLFVANTVKTPNGILWDAAAGRLVYCTWGTNAGLYAVNMADSSVASILSTTYGNFDGVVQDNHHNYYMSTWSANGILRSDSALTPVSLVVSGLSSPADIYYNLANDTLVAPGSDDTLTFHFFGVIDTTADTTIDSNTAIMAIRPAIAYFTTRYESGKILCTWSMASSNASEINIFDETGKLVFRDELNGEDKENSYKMYDAMGYHKGIYIVHLRNEKGAKVCKLLIE